MSDNSISSTTQEYLDVYDIANDLVILKDGTISMILQIGTMNFSLLAEQEQDAIMYTYGALLNSLNFPIQINIQSSTKDATKYLKLLDAQAEKAASNDKTQQIKRYRDFVANLIHERNVLEKKFLVSIPASVAEMGLYTAQSVLPGKTKFDVTSIEKAVLLEKASTILDPRRDHLIAQFNRIGLFARQINTQEIIQNFYINYNPESTEGQEVTNSDSYATPMVRASFGDQKVLQPTNSQVVSNVVASTPDPTPVLTPTQTLEPSLPPSNQETAVFQQAPPAQAQPVQTPPTQISPDNFSEEVPSLQISEQELSADQSLPLNGLGNQQTNQMAQPALNPPPIAEL